MTGKPDMGIVPYYWKRWSTRSAFAGPAIGPPTGPMLGKPPGAGAWTGNIKTTVKLSKTSTCIRWSAMPGNSCAVIPPGKQIRLSFPACDFDQGPGLRRHGLLVGYQTAVEGTLPLVAGRRDGAGTTGPSGAIVVRGGKPGFRVPSGLGAGVAESKLKKVEESAYVLTFSLACCGYAGTVALPRTDHRHRPTDLLAGVPRGASRQQPPEVIAAVV